MLDACAKAQVYFACLGLHIDVITPSSPLEVTVVGQWLEIVSCCLWGRDFFFDKVLSTWLLFLSVSKVMLCRYTKYREPGCF